jgi:hypothetical protein
MKRSLAAVVALLTAAPLLVAVAACDPQGKADAPSKGEPPATAAPDHAVVTAATEPAATANLPSTHAPLKVGGAPEFAAVYPGGVVEAPPTLAGGDAGPGGLVTFTTEAKPDAVIAFYKQRAEAAGLAQVMSLNRGDTVAYGAAEPTNGAILQVVATAADKAPTSVQLTWSAGQ